MTSDNNNSNNTIIEESGNRVFVYIAALIAIVLWASAFPGTRFVLEYYSPGPVMVLRFSVAAVPFLLIGIFKRIRLPRPRDLPLCIASGLSGVFLYQILFTTGSVTISAGVSSFIISAAPVFTMIFTTVFLKEKVKFMSWVGAFISFCGLAAVTLLQAYDFNIDVNLLLIIAASICSGIYSFVIRLLTKSYTAFEATAYTIIIGTLFTLIYLPDTIREIPGSNIQVNLAILFLGIFPAGVAYFLWGYAISKVNNSANVIVFGYLIPFISALVAYFWLGETITMMTIFGGIVIIIGMFITNIFGRK